MCIPSGFKGNPIAFFDDFSWRSFIAMVWPVQQGMRGVPDQSKSIGPVSGPLVFETYKNDWEVFRQSPGDNRPPPAPSPWNSYTGANPCTTSGAPITVNFGDVVLSSFSHFGNMGEAGQPPGPPLVGPLPAQNGTYTRYFTAYNQIEFSQIAAQQLYLRANLPMSDAGFNGGSIDIKAAWMDMSGVKNPQRYYTRTAYMMDPFANPVTCKKVTVGLVGLHIVQKTQSRPQWVWSTFEQIDNVPGGTSQGPFAYNNGKSTQPMPDSNPNGWPPPPTPSVFNVQRLTPINPSTIATDKALSVRPASEGRAMAVLSARHDAMAAAIASAKSDPAQPDGRAQQYVSACHAGLRVRERGAGDVRPTTDSDRLHELPYRHADQHGLPLVPWGERVAAAGDIALNSPADDAVGAATDQRDEQDASTNARRQSGASVVYLSRRSAENRASALMRFAVSRNRRTANAAEDVCRRAAID